MHPEGTQLRKPVPAVQTGCGEKDLRRSYSMGLDIAEGSHRREKRLLSLVWGNQPGATCLSLVYRTQLPSGDDPRSCFSTLGPRISTVWGFPPHVHIDFGKFRGFPRTKGPNKFRMGSVEMAVGMNLSPEGNRARATAEHEVEHAFVDRSADKIYKVCQTYEYACFLVRSRIFRFVICVSSCTFSSRWTTRCLPL